MGRTLERDINNPLPIEFSGVHRASFITFPNKLPLPLTIPEHRSRLTVARAEGCGGRDS